MLDYLKYLVPLGVKSKVSYTILGIINMIFFQTSQQHSNSKSIISFLLQLRADEIRKSYFTIHLSLFEFQISMSSNNKIGVRCRQVKCPFPRLSFRQKQCSLAHAAASTYCVKNTTNTRTSTESKNV